MQKLRPFLPFFKIAVSSRLSSLHIINLLKVIIKNVLTMLNGKLKGVRGLGTSE